MMRRFSHTVIWACLGMTVTSVSYAQSAPDPLVVRKAINESCLATQGAKAQVDEVEDLEIQEADRTIAVRVYRSNMATPLPILVFIHGGGFVAGNLDTHDNACRYLCKHTPCVVFSIDYRLSPEHKFPAQPNDCYAATIWAAKNANRFGGDPDRIAVIGDSAGGMLAATLCQESRDRKGPEFLAQVLVNPVLDFSQIDAKGFEGSRLFRSYYLNDLNDETVRLASPLLAENLSGLPPTLVLVAERDIRRGQGEAYVAKLREAGVPANSYCQYGVGHLGPMWAVASPIAQEPLDVAIGFLKAAIKRSQ